ncbi:MAG: DGQHR domain-containing protein, partial [Candidatus Bathyarchaeia archaeon]
VEKFVTLSKTFQRRGFIAWNNNAVIYYNKVGRTLGKWIKYELYKEFNISFEERQICKEGAVQIRQGDWEMYLLGVYPAVLLKIGYVSRRASGKPEAYQRILNKDRIKKVSDFIKSKGAILPNAIILAFDDDKDIQGKISYTNGILKFPKIYSSAWIIDGQHRIFGFLGTKFEDTDPDDPAEEFKLPVVAFRKLDDVMQNRTFVSINYNQKKIDPTLLCDLARSVPDLTNELTWPSLLVSELNKKGSFKDRVKISELDGRRPISLSSFARYGLLEGLLGFNKKAHDYQGVLFKFAPFNDRAQLKNLKNQGSLKKQSDLLRRYFGGVEKNTTKTSPRRDPWKNIKQYSLLKPAGINALLLVLSRIMEKYPKADLDFEQYLKPLKGMKFSRSYVSQQGGGWKGFRSLANSILRKLNQKHPKDRLRIFGEKDKW